MVMGNFRGAKDDPPLSHAVRPSCQLVGTVLSFMRIGLIRHTKFVGHELNI